MDQTIRDIIESNISNEEKILQLDRYFGFISQDDIQNNKKNLKVSEILNGRWNVPSTTTGYSGKLNSEEKEILIHYFYEQKIKIRK
jgi:hypothetical protein